MSDKGSSASGGIGIGAVIAILLSWQVNHSVFWCIVHALCSWGYVIYWLIAHSYKIDSKTGIGS